MASFSEGADTLCGGQVQRRRRWPSNGRLASQEIPAGIGVEDSTLRQRVRQRPRLIVATSQGLSWLDTLDGLPPESGVDSHDGCVPTRNVKVESTSKEARIDGRL